jgi:hypothetical protein
VDDGCLSVLVPLDLPAAFYNVHHEILLDRLDVSYGVGGMVLDRLWSHLTDCSRVECIPRGSSRSAPSAFRFGLPKGSVLSPLLFILYTADLIDLIDDIGFRPHLYADDTQNHGSCCRSSVDQLQPSLSACLDEVFSWMRSNGLQRNLANTEILSFST